MRVFLSYNARDAAFAKELMQHLDEYEIEVWDPARELLPGSNWLLEAGRALERSDGVIFLLSNHSTESPTFRREVEYAVTNQKFEQRVVPVMLSTNVKNVPWIFKKMQVVDATNKNAEAAAGKVAAALQKVTTLPRKRVTLKSRS